MRLVGLFLLLIPFAALAAPATFLVTPTFGAPASGGTVDTYNAYQGCDLAAQTSAQLIGPVTSSVEFSFAGDTATPPTICVRASNAFGEGGFATAYTLGIPPGPVSATYTCVIDQLGQPYQCVPVSAP